MSVTGSSAVSIPAGCGMSVALEGSFFLVRLVDSAFHKHRR